MKMTFLVLLVSLLLISLPGFAADTVGSTEPDAPATGVIVSGAGGKTPAEVGAQACNLNYTSSAEECPVTCDPPVEVSANAAGAAGSDTKKAE